MSYVTWEDVFKHFFPDEILTPETWEFVTWIFWHSFFVWGLITSYLAGFYHVWVIQLIPLVRSLFFSPTLGRFDFELICGIVWIQVFLRTLFFYVFERKKCNRNVYLVFSKKAMICKGYLKNKLFSTSKHWALLVTGKSGLAHLVDARGEILKNLTPKMSLISRSEAERLFDGFYRIGKTNSKCIRRFVKSQVVKCRTCQQYVSVAADSLVYPLWTSRTEILGRFEYIFALVIPPILHGILLYFGFDLININLLFLFALLGEYVDGVESNLVQNCTTLDVILILVAYVPFYYFKIDCVVFIYSASFVLSRVLAMVFVPKFDDFSKKGLETEEEMSHKKSLKFSRSHLLAK